MKFKIGDRVRVVKAMSPDKEYSKPHIGKTGRIHAIFPDLRVPYCLKFPRVPPRHAFVAGELELIKPKAKAKPKKK